MIELIAEHCEGEITVRGTVNNNLIVSESHKHLLDAMFSFHTACFDFEGIDLFKEPFTVTHEFS